MSPLTVNVKCNGTTHEVPVDPKHPPSAFKQAIFVATGVPVDRMKVMSKGGVLKDDDSWGKLAPKKGQTYTVIGAAGELPKPPAKPTVFLEDMDDSELADALAKPVGLRNLGNTCYMNATIQALRAIPELQVALTASALQSTTPLPGALRDLYQNMSRTTDSVAPFAFLQVLRLVNPQFAEIDRSEKAAGAGVMGHYAQQDAEECYGAVIQALRGVPGLVSDGSPPADGSAQRSIGGSRFVEQYLMGEMRRELRCDEAPEEPVTVNTEQVLKVECNISITTNYMLDGIMNSLDQNVDKLSQTLGRQAVYSQKSRLSRLPSYLTVHMVRFAWRADIGKKAKIMRKVKFPTVFDATALVTDELKAELLPVSRKLLEVEKERAERRKVRRRMKGRVEAGPAGRDVNMTDASGAADANGTTGTSASGAGELEDEETYRAREDAELVALVSPRLQADIGCSKTGLYELVAIVTHKGAAADAGHYMGYVKRSVFHEARSRANIPEGATSDASAVVAEDDEYWYKFDDDKVSVIPAERLETLDGGGEDSSAYLLLYRTRGV